MEIIDFGNIKKRFEAFWNNDFEGRCIVTTKAYKHGGKQAYYKYWERMSKDSRYRDAFHLKADPEIKIKSEMAAFEYFHYAGDTLPILDTYIGPGMSAAFLGSKVMFNDDGIVWFEKALENLDDFELEFDERNIWWSLNKIITEEMAKEAKGRFAVSICNDMYCGLDTLMHLRGSENLCLDMIMDPDTIKRYCTKITKLWKYWFDTLYSISNKYVEGNATGWLKYWGPGKTYQLQCDFMNMISPQMFEEFAMPDLKEMSEHLDYSIYHFDGPDEAKRHLPYLLELKSLNGIQWNPKENCENVRHIPILKEIQKAGKCLVLNTTVDEIDTLLSELSPKGLMLNINPFGEPFETPEEAEEVVKRVEKLCIGKS